MDAIAAQITYVQTLLAEKKADPEANLDEISALEHNLKELKIAKTNFSTSNPVTSNLDPVGKGYDLPDDTLSVRSSSNLSQHDVNLKSTSMSRSTSKQSSNLTESPLATKSGSFLRQASTLDSSFMRRSQSSLSASMSRFSLNLNNNFGSSNGTSSTTDAKSTCKQPENGTTCKQSNIASSSGPTSPKYSLKNSVLIKNAKDLSSINKKNLNLNVNNPEVSSVRSVENTNPFGSDTDSE